MTLLAGIFGYPISHSISPPMHQAAFDHAGIDASYEAWETHPDDLANGVRRLRDDSYLGANVTVPHKQAVIQHLDEVDELATRIGAVNTIINTRRQTSWYQYGRRRIHNLPKGFWGRLNPPDSMQFY